MIDDRLCMNWCSGEYWRVSDYLLRPHQVDYIIACRLRCGVKILLSHGGDDN